MSTFLDNLIFALKSITTNQMECAPTFTFDLNGMDNLLAEIARLTAELEAMRAGRDGAAQGYREACAGIGAERDGLKVELEAMRGERDQADKVRLEMSDSNNTLAGRFMKERDALKAQVARLTAPVTDEDMDVYWTHEPANTVRGSIQAVIAARAKGEEVDGLVYEDETPPMTDAQYAAWYAQSRIVHGVRMGPAVDAAGDAARAKG